MTVTSAYPGLRFRPVVRARRAAVNVNAGFAEDEGRGLKWKSRMAIAAPSLRPISQADGGPDNLQRALREWAAVIGPQHVKADASTRDQYRRTTGLDAHRPMAILYPETTAQVREILRIASASRIGVYPISRGKNWGYGDATPAGANQVVLDLRRMNRIIEVNAQLGYAVIEPGVTQRQLHRYLQEQRAGLWMDSAGAGLERAAVGNRRAA